MSGAHRAERGCEPVQIEAGHGRGYRPGAGVINPVSRPSVPDAGRWRLFVATGRLTLELAPARLLGVSLLGRQQRTRLDQQHRQVGRQHRGDA